jgi:hypothetical protein
MNASEPERREPRKGFPLVGRGSRKSQAQYQGLACFDAEEGG